MPTKHTSTRRSTTLLGRHARHRTSGLAAPPSSFFGSRDIHHSRFVAWASAPRTPRRATSCHGKMQASATTTTLSSVVVTWPSTASMYRPPPSHTIPAWAIRIARDYTSRRSPSASAVVPKRSSSAKSIAVLSLKSCAALDPSCAHTPRAMPRLTPLGNTSPYLGLYTSHPALCRTYFRAPKQDQGVGISPITRSDA